MTMNRQCAKTFLKSLDKYQGLKRMVEKAVDPDKPTLVKSLPRSRVNLEEAYLELHHSWKSFKRDLNLKNDEFNEEDEPGVPKFEYNDKWFEDTEEEYYVLVEKSDDKLGEGDTVPKAIDEEQNKEDKANVEMIAKQKSDLKLLNQMSDQIESMTEAISSSISKIGDEVRKMVDGNEGLAKVQAYKADLSTIEDKIDEKFQRIYSQYVCYLDDVEAKEKKSFKDNFVNMEKAKIDNLVILLNKKVKESAPPSSLIKTLEKKGDQVYLKKLEPPDFKGDIVEYADFVRKWKAQVGKANLSAESELDRLRDHVPDQAAKSLYGETTLAGAWKVLDKLYGDKDLIASKLKIQLKSIKPKGKKDQDIIIDLVTDVNNIALRLKTLNMEQMLIVDC